MFALFFHRNTQLSLKISFLIFGGCKKREKGRLTRKNNCRRDVNLAKGSRTVFFRLSPKIFFRFFGLLLPFFLTVVALFL
jgi:hypothetical protein